MAISSPPRPAREAGPAPGSRSGHGFRNILIVVVVVGVLAGVGYAVNDQIPGLKPTMPTLPAIISDPYIEFWNKNSEAAPPEFSVGAIRGLANDCLVGGLMRNVPQYLPADQYDRARGGYVCLLGEPVPAKDLRCPAPGTTGWRRLNHLTPIQITFVAEEHIIGKGVGGDGSATIDGKCVNMVPQSREQNSKMAVQAEQRMIALVTANRLVPFLYIVVPIYSGKNYMPASMNVFVISELGPPGPPITPFENLAFHITQVGGAP